MQEEYNQEIFKSEKHRATLLIGLLLFEALLLIIIYYFNKEEYYKVFKTPLSIFAILLFTGLLILYEILVHYILFNFSKLSPVKQPKIFGYFNSFSEISLLTLLLIIIIEKTHSPVILQTPAALTYFIFIVLSVFRLDFKLSVFTGFIAAIEFLIISFLYTRSLNNAMGEEHFILSNIHYLGQALIMIITGIAAGFAAEVIKNKMMLSWKTAKEKMEVIHLFGQQISPQIVENILHHKDELSGARKKVTVMFLDIRNFTPFVESHQPEEVVDYLNKIFAFMIDIVQEYNGVINQFLGDGFMATFGAPVTDEQSPENATKAAKKIIDELIKRNQDGSIPYTKIGIGLHYDEAVTGNIGSNIRKQFSITGRVVVMASRIEQLNKKYHSSMLISKEVYEKLNEECKQDFEYLDKTTVKGSERPVILYKYKVVID